MKYFVFSFLTCLSLFVKMEGNLQSITFLSDSFIMFLMFIFLYLFYRKNSNLKKNKWFYIFSSLFSIIMLIGNSFELTGSFSYLFQNIEHIVLMILSFFGYFILFWYLLSNGYELLKKNVKTNKIFMVLENHPFLSTFIILSLCYLIYMIAFYPAILSPDPSNQIKQFFNIETKYLDSVIVEDSSVFLTNHHPVFHTLLLGGCIKLGLLFSNFNLGLFFYTLLQTVTLISILSYTIYYLKKLSVSPMIRYIILLFYAMNPVFPFYAMSTVKDTFFTCFVILYVLFLIDFVRGEKITKKQMILFLITTIFMILFRNNGIHVFILSFPFLFLILKKLWKKLLFILIFILLFNFSYSNILLPYFHIPEGSIREMLSIPFQQTARYVSKHEESILEEEKNTIDKILSYDTLKDRYKPNISDPVKEKFNKYATREDLKEYFLVWIKQGIKDPVVYLEATISNTYGYFYPNTSNWYIYYKYDTRLKDAGFEYSYNSLKNLREILQDYGKSFIKIPFLGMSINIGFNGLLLLFLCMCLIYEKKYKYIIILLPSLILLLICVASPVNTYFRYAMPYIFLMPTLVSSIHSILKDNEKL